MAYDRNAPHQLCQFRQLRERKRNIGSVRLSEAKALLGSEDDGASAGICRSDSGVDRRSEAAAFLIGEGAKARQNLFNRIDEKVQQIRAVKDELRQMAGDMNEPANKSAE